MKKEFFIFLLIFLFLTFSMHHKEWISSPLEHINHLKNAGAYGMGAIHPLIFTVVVYILLWVPRIIIRMVKKKG